MENNFNQAPVPEPQPKTQKELKLNSSFLKFASIMVLMVIVGLIASYVLQNYFSPEARENQRLEEQYRKYQEFETGYKQAMANDTYGGKTPQETLDLFVAALEQGDLELASRYFVLNSIGQRDEKWLSALEKTRQEGKLNLVASLLKKATPDIGTITGDEDFKFKVYEDGKLQAYINMQLNTYSNVWKIESI